MVFIVWYSCLAGRWLNMCGILVFRGHRLLWCSCFWRSQTMCSILVFRGPRLCVVFLFLEVTDYCGDLVFGRHRL